MAALSPRDSLPRRFFQRLRQPVGRFGLGGKIYPFQDWLGVCLKSEFNLSPDRIVKLYDEHLPKWTGASSIDLAQRTDLRNYMLEDILIKVDRMSMLHSLEVRSPFLDYRMVELGLRIPSPLRVKDGQNKYLLRRLAARHLPDSVCQAAKRGFGIPWHSWLNGGANGRDLATVLMDNQHTNLDPFTEGGAERLWRLGRSRPALAPMIFLLLSFRWWCQRHASIGPQPSVSGSSSP